MPASQEFIALCRSQVMVLTQAFGASLSVIYLTDELKDDADTSLVPIVAYPETALSWPPEQVLAIPASISPDSNPRLLTTNELSAETRLEIESGDWQPLEAKSSTEPPTASQSWQPSPPPTQVAYPWQVQDVPLHQRLVLPLMHEGLVLGILVTGRSDRAWQAPEQDQIERIAQTLALACVLDQRGQWWQQDRQQQRLLQAKQQDLFHTLLHQFRNPLTALRTFGKLLLRRFASDDPNRELVEGLVRESDRLQDLLRQFESVVALGDHPHQLQAAADEDDAITWEAHIETRSDAGSTDSQDTNSSEDSLPNFPILLPGAGFSLEPDQQLLAAIVTPLLQSAQAIAQDRQLQLHSELALDLPAVNVDERALREVLSNVLDNALKYTPPGGEILIRLCGLPYPEVYEQVIVVADTGPGIPAQDQEHLFEWRYRGVQAQSEIPGTGLGLAIARDLIQRMGGTIQVFSPASSSDLLGQFASIWQHQNHPGTAVVLRFPTPNP